LVGPTGIFADGDWIESKDQDPEGNIRLIQLADIGDGRYLNKSARFMTPERAKALRCSFLEPGDVLVSRMADPLGRACIFPGDPKQCVTVVDVCIIRPDQSAANPAWLMHEINTPQFRDIIAQSASGTTRARISRSNLGALELPVPPLPEQRRIVTKLEDLLARSRRAKGALNAIPPLLEKLRQSVLAAAFRGDLTADWRDKHPKVEPADKLLARIRVERRKKWEEVELAKLTAKGKAPKDDRWKEKYEEPEAVDASDLPELPEGWCWASPREAFIWASGKFLPRDAQRTGSVSVYGGNGIAGTHDEFLVPNPTIVVGRVGADCGNVHLTAGPSWITDNAIFASFVPDSVILPYFIMGLRRANLRTAARGGGQPFVSQETLNNVVFPLAPLPEQVALMRAVEEYSATSASVLKMLAASESDLATLDRSILAKAFRGELVPQDPNDEPAEAMLARLRAAPPPELPARARKRKPSLPT
jgi:type I restriction enzyme S subunit